MQEVNVRLDELMGQLTTANSIEDVKLYQGQIAAFKDVYNTTLSDLGGNE